MGKYVKQFLEKFPPLNDLEADVGFFFQSSSHAVSFLTVISQRFFCKFRVEASSKGSANLLLQHETGEMGVMVTVVKQSHPW